jgi:hypothetical protein
MKKTAIRLMVFATLALAAAGSALATSSLSFEGGGYWIELEIGSDRTPVIASVHFHEPADPRGVVLAPGTWDVESFDTDQQVLVLRHRGGNAGVEPFTLSVRHRSAVLAIGERKIRSSFGWLP